MPSIKQTEGSGANPGMIGLFARSAISTRIFTLVTK